MTTSLPKAILSLIPLVFLASTAHAETTAKIHAGGTLTRGNSETFTANAGLLREAKSDRSSLTQRIEGNYGETTATGDVTDTTVQTVEAEIDYKHSISDALYGVFNINAFHDDIAHLDYRLSVSPGLGYPVIKNDKATLGLELGVAWIREEYDIEPDPSDDYAALRVAQVYSRQLSETAKVWQSLEWTPELASFGNYLLVAEIGIEANIVGDLSLRLVAQDKYDNEPPAGNDKNDLNVVVGLSYQL